MAHTEAPKAVQAHCPSHLASILVILDSTTIGRGIEILLGVLCTVEASIITKMPAIWSLELDAAP